VFLSITTSPSKVFYAGRVIVGRVRVGVLHLFDFSASKG
jgi:hypothetical protein